MGIPVVSRDLPEIRGFGAEHGEVVAVARDAASFAAAIREALGKTSPGETARRVEGGPRESRGGRRGGGGGVVGGGGGRAGKGGGGFQERVKHAVDLYRHGQAARLIFSSGYAFAFREDEGLRGRA